MNTEARVKQQVREFYDSVGWKEMADGLYQNARYEDLRPVARDYVHLCHLRLKRFLPDEGALFLDAGSGPIQYPEYLEYADGFGYRVCLDISELALRQARERIGDRGLFVVGDITRLPFADSSFEGLISLHAIHHLPLAEHEAAMRELARMLADGGRGVIVYSWGEHSPLMRLARLPIAAAQALRRAIKPDGRTNNDSSGANSIGTRQRDLMSRPGTYTAHHDYAWAMSHVADLPGFEIRTWRSVSTAFTRALMFDALLGRLWLRLLYWLEDVAPHWFGRMGQYPLFVLHKATQRVDLREESRV